MAQIFMSPGVYQKEQDFSVFASRVGITRLGIAGKFPKGPAFEGIKVSSTEEQALRFGYTNPNYPATYVADAYLSQANELNVCRVLGTTGFVNSPAWIITADESATYGVSSTVSGATFALEGMTSNTNYEVIIALSATSPHYSASTIYVEKGTGISAVTVYYSAHTMETLVDALNSDATWATTAWSVTGGDTNTLAGFTISGAAGSMTPEAKGEYSGTTLAIIRSKQHPSLGTFYFSGNTQIQIGTTTDAYGRNLSSALGSFVISGSTGELSTGTTRSYTFTLDETRDDYIVRYLGKSPDYIAGAPNFYVERIFPHFAREATNRAQITGLKATLVYKATDDYTDFEDSYTNAVTPWIVSRVVGGSVKQLFKVHMLSDGDASNTEAKISFQNIDPVTKTFTLVVRRFDDTDATASSTALESFPSLTMDDSQPNFIGKAIGTVDEDFPRKSSFIAIELAELYPYDAVPAGFEGYEIRGDATVGLAANNAHAPAIYYKTGYASTDSVVKTYLGLSELAYTSLTSSVVSTSKAVKSVEADLFAYKGGYTTSATTTTKGFHLENTADAASFVSGDKATLESYEKTGLPGVVDKSKLKFTVVPYGGFDGWDKYEYFTESYAQFTPNKTDNVAAFKTAIDTFSNPYEIDINLFATPGVDFDNNLDIVNYALAMVEDRLDTLYIIDAPRITDSTDKGTSDEVVSLLENSGINSSYAATYWPWVQIEDANTGKYTYQPPTMLVVKAIAYTDNIAYSWFAPAGLNRGLAGIAVKKVDVKSKKDDLDTLYNNRVNPVAYFVQQGISLWGQKTLQVRQSALDRINVRRLMLQVQRLVAAASITMVFEQNDQTLRDQFLAKVEPILLQIQSQRGLYAYKVICDSSNNTDDTIDRNILTGKIQLKPTRVAEFISLTYQVLPTGANFESF